ncbi:restriction endonuclease [Domibacillus epiphyticus]|uniref:Uncharacterized protein n=1 Tax=Domibacillus epiphyticus TaxID=1714355 RepID=A0A1V2ACH2_9BACI|nr:restriction endonuclease [Domibacillus epiphyticus]OMP68695.1 hypothetical protein BTO28_01205 [Domibacillus epiphyticus]
MNWTNFKTHNQAPTQAFETFCIQLFERWARRTYKDNLKNFYVVNGAGGDGGVEAYAELQSDEIVAVQAKWFPSKIEDQQIRQIKSSIETAMSVRSNIISYTVCIPRDLGNETGRGGNSEQSRWDSMESDILDTYTNLELVLWNESSLTTELQQSGNEGIRKFWFESEEFDFDFLKRRFDLMMAGWLKERYIPSLHAQGRIEQTLEGLLISADFRDGSLFYIKDIKSKMEIAKQELEIALNDIEIIPVEKQNVGRSTLESIEKYILLLYKLEDALIKGLYIDEYIEPESINFSGFKQILEESPRSSREIARLQLTKAMNELDVGPLVFDQIWQIGKALERHNTIITGQPGTGKTHGITDIVNKRLSNSYPSILIRAKDVRASEGWGSILRQALGLSSAWSEEELFSALEATAIRAHINRIYNEDKKHDLEIEETTFLIAVDGIEESVELDAWKNRLGELDQILITNQKIRFCIMARPYVFENKPLPLSKVNLVKIRDEGDVPVSYIFDEYISTYNIDVTEVPWVRFTLKTPLALRLFCEIYAGKTLRENDSIKTTVAHLLLAKIMKIDNEVKGAINGRWDQSDKVILKGLTKLVKILSTSSSIPRTKVIKVLHDAQSPEGLITLSEAAQILDYLVKYGLIYESINYDESDPLSEHEADYNAAIQPLMDFLIAREAIIECEAEGFKYLPEYLKELPAALNMAALQLFMDYNLFIGKELNFEDGLEDELLDQIRWFVLANSPINLTEEYKDWIKECLTTSTARSRSAIKSLIIPVASVPNHPVGPLLLHETLMEYPSPAERDIIWSVPDDIPSAGGERHPISEILRLLPSQQSDGLPLIVAWSLTSVEEMVIEDSKIQLTEWGSKNVNELLKLLDRVFQSNDPQMLQELANVIYGVSCLIRDIPELKKLANWVHENIFSRIQYYKNAIIRQSARGVIERAVLFGAVEENLLTSSRPPYSHDDELLPIDESATLKVTQEQGRGWGVTPITSDLAWYVIKKGYEPFFENNPITSSKSSEAIEHLSKYDIENLTPHAWAIGAAIEIIKGYGWSETRFLSPEDGIDTTIIRKYQRATHGSKSTITTIAEKYVWIAVFELLGYLSDRLPILDQFSETISFKVVDDYSILINTNNSAYNLIVQKEEPYKQWFLPNSLTPTVHFTDSDPITQINEWVENAETPNIIEWILPTDENLPILKSDELAGEWISLNGFTALTERESGGESLFWINTFLIKNEDKSELNKIKKGLETMDSLDGFYGSIASETYMSPADVIWIPWLQEVYNLNRVDIQDSENGGGFLGIKAGIVSVTDSTLAGEVSISMPSKDIRQALSITDLLGYKYIDEKNKVKGFYTSTGIPYQDEQKMLFVRREVLDEIIPLGYSIIWGVRLLRKPSARTLEKHRDMALKQIDKYWIVNREEDWKVHEII